MQSDLNVFKAIFNEFYPDMIKVALFYVHDLPVAEDMVQDVFAKLWESRKEIGAIDNIRAYLTYAVKNRCLNYLEHEQAISKHQQEYIRQLAEEESVEELISAVQTSLAKLPPKRRKIVELSVVEGKSYQEIADQEEISINTVKDHIKKAYAFLREEIRQDLRKLILFFALRFSTLSLKA